MALVAPWGSEGRPHALPSLPNRRQNAFFPAFGFPLFPLLFFSFSFSPSFPGRQPRRDFEWRQGGRGLAGGPAVHPSERSRGSWAEQERSIPGPPPAWPLAVGPVLGVGCGGARSGPLVGNLWNFLLHRRSGLGKLVPAAQTHRRLICSRKKSV